MGSLDPLPRVVSLSTAGVASNKEGVDSVDPLQGKVNESSSTPTVPDNEGTGSNDPLPEKADGDLEGKEETLLPGNWGICDLLAGYFRYYAMEFNHATEVCGRGVGVS